MIFTGFVKFIFLQNALPSIIYEKSAEALLVSWCSNFKLINGCTGVSKKCSCGNFILLSLQVKENHELYSHEGSVSVTVWQH